MNQPEEFNQPEEPLAELEQKELERELMQALRPVAAPEGFAQRTLARVLESNSESKSESNSESNSESKSESKSESAPARFRVIAMRPRPRLWASAAIAAALLAGVFIVEQTHLRRQREEAELAQQQFEAALRITGETLEQTRRQLQQAGVQLGN